MQRTEIKVLYKRTVRPFGHLPEAKIVFYFNYLWRTFKSSSGAFIKTALWCFSTDTEC